MKPRNWYILLAAALGTAVVLGALYALSLRGASDTPFFYGTR
ncbi:MAG: hypothetical protein ACXVB9_12620 [Bdellovibrionota bacterium]